MEGQIPKSLYYPDTAETIAEKLEADIMPGAFARRMRLINLISAVVLRKIDAALLSPFDVEDLHHTLNLQINQDAIIDQFDNKEIAEALRTGNLRPLWALVKT